MIAISNLKLAPGADEAQLRTLAAGPKPTITGRVCGGAMRGMG